MSRRLIHTTVNAAAVQTTDTTVTTVHTWTPAAHVPAIDNCVLQVEATLIGRSSGNAGVTIKFGGTYKVISGTLSLLGTPAAIQAAIGDAAMLVSVLSLDASSNVLRARVAGVTATTIDWQCYLEIKTTNFG